jgi:hypothetical protein
VTPDGATGKPLAPILTEWAILGVAGVAGLPKVLKQPAHGRGDALAVHVVGVFAEEAARVVEVAQGHALVVAVAAAVGVEERCRVELSQLRKGPGLQVAEAGGDTGQRGRGEGVSGVGIDINSLLLIKLR